MSTIKTKIDQNSVVNFLQENFDKSIKNINFLTGGEQSQAFSFTMNNQNFVIRINKYSYSFEKDKYAFDHFNNVSLPIPEILEIGKFNEKYFYSISREATGITINLIDKETKLKLLPQIIAIHNAIRNTKIEGDGKFGDWDKNGNAEFKNWKEFFIGKKDEVYKNWEHLYQTTFLERETVEKLTKKMNELVPFLPEERFLLHGDFGGDNMVTNGEKITGVIDWEVSKYGDSLYDIAWLEFFNEDLNYSEIFYKHYGEKNYNTRNFKERILCYKLHLGLGTIGFFALSGQKLPYDWSKNKLLKLISDN